MSQHYLMQHPVVGLMYVPPEKKAEYELRGYKVIEAPVNTVPGPPAAEDIEAGPAPEAVEKESRPKRSQKKSD